MVHLFLVTTRQNQHRKPKGIADSGKAGYQLQDKPRGAFTDVCFRLRHLGRLIEDNHKDSEGQG